MKYIIPGINLFSDDHRLYCVSMIDNLIWLSKRFIFDGFFVEVQPLLTLVQYLASTIAKNLYTSFLVKLLRIESLCEIQFFGEAIDFFVQVCCGKNLPSPANVIKNKYQGKWSSFASLKKVFDIENGTIISQLCGFKLLPIHQNVYGKFICRKMMLIQAFILIKLASVIHEIPAKQSLNEKNVQVLNLEKEVVEKANTGRRTPASRKSKEKELTVQIESSLEMAQTSSSDNISADRKGSMLEAALSILKDIQSQTANHIRGKGKNIDFVLKRMKRSGCFAGFGTICKI